MSHRPVHLFLVALFGLAACGDERPASSSRKIAVIPKGTTHEFWKSIHAGANKAGAELSVEILWKGPSKEDDRDDQIKIVEDFISRGVDGIVLAPLDDKALVRPCQDAAKEGIPVVITDSGLDWEGYVSFVVTDNYRGGQLGGACLGDLLVGKESAKVLIMRYQEGSESTMKREAGFLDTLKERYPNVDVVSSNQYGGATTESSYQTAENLLISFPDVDGIFCPNETTTFGMLRALQDSGRAGAVRFVGFDASEKLVDALAGGVIDGLVVQNPFRMGYDGVKAVVAHLDGLPVERRVDTGVLVATAENMTEPAVKALLAPEIDRWLK